MQSAPPVRVSVERSHGWAVFVAAVCGLAAGNLAGWALLWREADHAAAWAVVVGAVAGVAAGWLAWRRAVIGELAWDGTRWSWNGRDGPAQVALDLGGWLLVRVGAPGAAAGWCPLSRRAVRGDWSALRAALYFPRGAADTADPLQAPPA